MTLPSIFRTRFRKSNTNYLGGKPFGTFADSAGLFFWAAGTKTTLDIVLAIADSFGIGITPPLFECAVPRTSAGRACRLSRLTLLDIVRASPSGSEKSDSRYLADTAVIEGRRDILPSALHKD
jgi:hypothetical protein